MAGFGSGGITVPVVSTWDDKGLAAAKGDIRRFDAQASQSAGGMRRLGVAGVAMGAMLGTAALQAAEAGARMAVKFGVDSVKAFMEDDLAVQKLSTTLGNLGLAHKQAGVEDFISKLQNSAAIEDNVLRPAMDRLVRATRNVTEAQSLLALAADISATKHISLESAANSLAKAAEGNTSALGRLGVGYSAADLKAMGFSGTISALTKDFAGGAATAAGSYQGTIDKITIAFGDLQESFGKGFFAGVEKGMGSTKDAGTDLQTSLLGLQASFEDLGSSIGEWVQYLPKAIAGMKLMIDAATMMREMLFLVVKGFIAVGQAMTGDWQGAARTISEGFDRVKVSALASAEAAANMMGYTIDPSKGREVNVLAARYAGLADAANAAAAAVARTAANAPGDRYTAMARAAGKSISFTGGNLSTYFDDPKDGSGGSGGGSSAVSAATKAAEAFAAAQAKVKEKVDAARKATNDAIKTFDDYATSASEAISSKLSIGTAVDVFNQRAEDVKTALKNLVDYQATLSTEQTDAEKKKVAELQGIYQAAQQQAAVGGASIVDTFVQQAEKVAEFGRKMQQLLAAGLNETSFKEISSMSLERGMQTADAFLDGNISENIRRTNDAVGSVKSVADQVGLDAAKQFASVGIQMAVSMVEALMEAIGPKGKGRKALAAMMDSLAASLNRTATITVSTIGNTSGVTNPGVASSGDAAALDSLAGIGGDLGLFPGVDLSGVNWGALTGFANGGEATGTFLVGEAGPEILSIGSSRGYVTPNSALGGNTYSITVNAGVGDPREIGRSVVQYIKRFEQASGPVFASA